MASASLAAPPHRIHLSLRRGYGRISSRYSRAVRFRHRRPLVARCAARKPEVLGRARHGGARSPHRWHRIRLPRSGRSTVCCLSRSGRRSRRPDLGRRRKLHSVRRIAGWSRNLRRQAANPATWLTRSVDRFPFRLAAPLRRVAASFAEGIIWPREAWRGGAILLASVLIKLFAATQFLGAGLAFGIRLYPAEYLFLMVFLGFLVIVGHFAR